MRAKSQCRRQCLTPVKRSMPKRSAAATRPKILRRFVPYWKKWPALNEPRGAAKRGERRTAERVEQDGGARGALNVIARRRSAHGGGGARPQQSARAQRNARRHANRLECADYDGRRSGAARRRV